MMSRTIEKDGYLFDFSEDVIHIIGFDDECTQLCDGMKKVDIIAEFPGEYLFLELKRYKKGKVDFKCPIWKEPKIVNTCPLKNNEKKRHQATINRVATELRQKYFDTFLYRYEKDYEYKPINYICVVEADPIIAQGLQEKVLLPKKTKILKNFAIVNQRMWNNEKRLLKYAKCSLLTNY